VTESRYRRKLMQRRSGQLLNIPWFASRRRCQHCLVIGLLNLNHSYEPRFISEDERRICTSVTIGNSTKSSVGEAHRFILKTAKPSDQSFPQMKLSPQAKPELTQREFFANERPMRHVYVFWG
jgi:hypothetical protein